MDCTPKSDYLRALCAQSLNFKTMLGELIDNSLDAGAMTIEIEFRKDAFSIRDNGDGCANLGSLFTLGDHRHHRSTRLGRYGIGAKDALLSLGGEDSSVTVVSVHGRDIREVTVRWAEMARNNWHAPDPTKERAEVGERGTSLLVKPCPRQPLGAARISNLRSDLGYMYSPAIKDGAQISIAIGGSKPEPLVRWKLPDFESGHISETVIAAGKRANVHCGIVKEGQLNPRWGLTYAHGFRVILPSCANGCGEFNTARVCGFVMLDESWKLSKNKNAILEDEEQLYAAVLAALTPLLKRADELGSRLESAAFESQIAGAINASLGADSKAKRDDGDSAGPRRPTGKGGRHKRAREEQDGSTFLGRRSACGSYRVVHMALGEAAGIGEFKEPTIALNTDNPLVESARREKNLMTSTVLAASLISAEHCLGTGQLRLPLRGVLAEDDETKKFARAMGAILQGHMQCATKPDERVAS